MGNLDYIYGNHKEHRLDMITTWNTDCKYDNHKEHGLQIWQPQETQTVDMTTTRNTD